MLYIVTSCKTGVQKRSRRTYSTQSEAYDAAVQHARAPTGGEENSWHILLKYVFMAEHVLPGMNKRVCYETSGHQRSVYISVDDNDADGVSSDSDASMVDT